MRTRPWTMLLMMLAGWLNRHHQDVIEYLKEENKILREKIGTKRIILNDNQRMRLAQCLGARKIYLRRPRNDGGASVWAEKS